MDIHESLTTRRKIRRETNLTEEITKPTLQPQTVAGQDLNLRPSGYEPDELPDCSTPQQKVNYEESGAKLQAMTV